MTNAQVFPAEKKLLKVQDELYKLLKVDNALTEEIHRMTVENPCA